MNSAWYLRSRAVRLPAFLVPACVAVSLAVLASPAAAQGLPSGLQEKAQDAAMDKAKEVLQEKAQDAAKDQLKDQMGGAGLPSGAPAMPGGNASPSLPGDAAGIKSKLP